MPFSFLLHTWTFAIVQFLVCMLRGWKPLWFLKCHHRWQFNTLFSKVDWRTYHWSTHRAIVYWGNIREMSDISSLSDENGFTLTSSVNGDTNPPQFSVEWMKMCLWINLVLDNVVLIGCTTNGNAQLFVNSPANLPESALWSKTLPKFKQKKE